MVYYNGLLAGENDYKVTCLPQLPLTRIIRSWSSALLYTAGRRSSWRRLGMDGTSTGTATPWKKLA